MATEILCSLSHWTTGVPKGWSIGDILRIDRLSSLWRGQSTDARWDILEHLSAEALRAGVCPNHVRILRYRITQTFVDRR